MADTTPTSAPVSQLARGAPNPARNAAPTGAGSGNNERRLDGAHQGAEAPALPVRGTIATGDQTVDVDAASSSGTLDWGRGVWEYRSFWVWASASGFLGDGRRVGLNLGFGFGGTSAATENTLILDGRIHKLAGVEFDYDPGDFMRPWTMRSERVDLTFTPVVERRARTNLLVIRSEVHQMFGTYSGTMTDDAGARHSVDGVVGWAEEHHAHW